MTDHISPDGRWRWDGQHWLPNMSKPAPSLPPKQRRMSTGGILAIVAASTIAFFAFVIMVVALSSAGSKSNSTAKATPTPAASAAPQAKPTPAPAAAPAAPACQQPCAVANDVTVSVSDVHYGASSGNPYINPEAGNVYVTMMISATSQRSGEASINPFDFVLRDGAGVKHRTTFSASDSCSTWQAVNLTKGSSIANKCLFFEATADKPAGLTLVWTPSLFGGDHDIKLS